MGFLPLALVLLGARLAALPDLSLQQLLMDLRANGAAAQELQKARAELRANRGVVESMLVSWEPLTNVAKKLAILLALMAPAVIPWNLVERCWRGELEEIYPSDLLDAQAEILLSNLLERQQKGLYKLHSLVRDFLLLQAEEIPETAKQWKSHLATSVAAVTREIIPDSITLEQVAEVDPYIQHVVQVAGKYPAHLLDQDLARPFLWLGLFYEVQGDYVSALPWYKRGLVQCEQRLGPDHPDTATSLNGLAKLYFRMGRYTKAEPLFLRSLEIIEKALGPKHPDTAMSLNNLGVLYGTQGDYATVEPLYRRALAIIKKTLGPDHLYTSHHPQQSRGAAFQPRGLRQGRAPLPPRPGDQREGAGARSPRYRPTASTILRSCTGTRVPTPRPSPSISAPWRSPRRRWGPITPLLPLSLNNLAVLYRSQGAYAKAEPLYLRALAIREKALGPDHPDYRHQPQQPRGAVPDPGRLRQGRAPLPPRPGDHREGAGTRSPRYRHQPQQSRGAASQPRAPTPRPSPSSSAPWRSERRRWGPSTPTPPKASTTSRSYTGARVPTPRPSPSTSAPWRSPRRRWDPITPLPPPSLNNLAGLHLSQGRLRQGRAPLPPRPGDQREGAGA